MAGISTALYRLGDLGKASSLSCASISPAIEKTAIDPLTLWDCCGDEMRCQAEKRPHPACVQGRNGGQEAHFFLQAPSLPTVLHFHSFFFGLHIENTTRNIFSARNTWKSRSEARFGAIRHDVRAKAFPVLSGPRRSEVSLEGRPN